MAADEDDTSKDAGKAEAGKREAASGGAERRLRQRPPVTIDLTAAAVPTTPAPTTTPVPQAEAPKAEASKADADNAPKGETRADGEGARRPSGGAPPGAGGAIAGRDGWRNAGLAGVAGGIVALILVLLLQAAGVLPAPGRNAANDAIAQAKSAADAVAALDKRVAALEAATNGVGGDLKSATDRIAALEAAKSAYATHDDVQTVAGEVGALDKKIAALPQIATAGDLTALSDRVGKLEVSVAAGGGASANSDAIAALTSQLADAESKVRALSERIDAADAEVAALGTPSGDGTAGRAIAAAALRRAAADGTPFAADLDLIASYGIDAGDVATLKPLAASGVKTAAALAAEFPAVGDAILAATTANDPNRSFFQRLLDSLVSVQPAGPVAGGDPAAIVSRMRGDAAKGDLAAALSEREGLSDAGKQASAAWAAEANNRVTVDTLTARIADALTGKPATAG
jgi:hypothetical protein